MNTLYAIKNLAIKNFKCYDDSNQRVSFGKKLTIIIGQNGAGKTVFLNALKKVLSIILTKDRRHNVNFIGDVINIKQNTLKDSDARYNFNFTESGSDYEFPVVVSCEGVIRNESVNWYIEKVNKGSRSVMTYREALDVFLSPLNNLNVYPKLPVLCYFSDSYPHVRNDLSLYEKDILFSKSDNPERRAGYYRWDDDNVDFLFWSGMFVNAFKQINDTVTGLRATEESLEKQDLHEGIRMVLLQRKERLRRILKEIDYISHVLIQFTHSISNISVHLKSQKVL